MSAHVVYLHGFASGPAASAKACFLRTELATEVAGFIVPDLEGDDFFNLTMDHRRQRAVEAIATLPADRRPLLLIGSSLGAYQAAELAAAGPGRIAALLLIAPAFGFVERWRGLLGEAGLADWERDGQRIFHHYRSGTERPLGAGFLRDCHGLPAVPPPATVPTVVIHGRQDLAADYHYAWRYVEAGAGVEFHLLDGPHSLDEPRHLACIAAVARDLLRRLADNPGSADA